MKTAHRTIALAAASFLAVYGCAFRGKKSDLTASVARDETDETISRILESVPYRNGPSLFKAFEDILCYGKLAGPALEKGLAHNNPAVRSFAAGVLGGLNDPIYIPPLKKMENDPNPAARYEAAFSRVELGDWSSISILIGGLEDPDRVIRYKCFDMLSSVTGLTFGYDWAEGPERRKETAARWREWWNSVSAPTRTASSFKTPE